METQTIVTIDEVTEVRARETHISFEICAKVSDTLMQYVVFNVDCAVVLLDNAPKYNITVLRNKIVNIGGRQINSDEINVSNYMLLCGEWAKGLTYVECSDALAQLQKWAYDYFLCNADDLVSKHINEIYSSMNVRNFVLGDISEFDFNTNIAMYTAHTDLLGLLNFVMQYSVSELTKRELTRRALDFYNDKITSKELYNACIILHGSLLAVSAQNAKIEFCAKLSKISKVDVAFILDFLTQSTMTARDMLIPLAVAYHLGLCKEEDVYNCLTLSAIQTQKQ